MTKDISTAVSLNLNKKQLQKLLTFFIEQRKEIKALQKDRLHSPSCELEPVNDREMTLWEQGYIKGIEETINFVKNNI